MTSKPLRLKLFLDLCGIFMKNLTCPHDENCIFKWKAYLGMPEKDPVRCNKAKPVQQMW